MGVFLEICRCLSSWQISRHINPKDFLAWVQKLINAGWKIVSCYEAELTALGVST